MTKTFTESLKVEDFVLTDEGTLLYIDGVYLQMVATGEQVHYGTGELRETPYINLDGKIVVSSTPMMVDAGVKPVETLEQQINRIMVHSLAAHYHIEEDLLEADDFDVPDDVEDPVTKYEQDFNVSVVESMERGVVRPPSNEELETSRKVIQRARDYVANRKKPQGGDSEASHSTEKPPLEPTQSAS